MTLRIDLNADVGESFGQWRLGDDAALLAIVTSANVACGFHAGDPSTLRRTCDLAVANDVAIGAQVSFRDLAGFGRRFLDTTPTELADDVLYQLGGLDAFARTAGSPVRYVKPHGALYHALAARTDLADAVVDAIASYDVDLAVLGMPGSALLAAAAEQGLRPVTEAFADRAYTTDGDLLDRRRPGALLTDPAEIAARCVRLVADRTLTSVDGTEIEVAAESICVHGDTPGAVEIATLVRATLESGGVTVASFLRPVTS